MSEIKPNRLLQTLRAVNTHSLQYIMASSEFHYVQMVHKALDFGDTHAVLEELTLFIHIEVISRMLRTMPSSLE